MAQLFTNNGLSLLSNYLGPTDTDIHVIPGDGHLYPQPISSADYFIVTLEDSTATYREIIKCDGRTGDVLHVAAGGRGFEGTGIQSWSVDTLVDHRATAHFYNRIAAAPPTPPSTSTNIAGQDPLLNTVVNPTLTGSADAFVISYPNQLTCKWIITVLDPLSQRVSVAEVLACYRGTVNPPMYSVYAKTGDKLGYHIEVDTTGANLELNVTNVDTIPLHITWVRINN